MPNPKQKIGKIESRQIETEMEQSYLDYAMSVIISRALPDVRDGLKPVHRRILYAMWEQKLFYSSGRVKSAAVVGEVMKSYHPHGDAAIYDTLVRMAQDFSMRHTLISGQGNFGSLDGDSPAAMRYTEVKISKICEEMLWDIEKETVDFQSNYDDTKKEPKVLPAKLPNLLINGSMGIAVGMATSIPPHNLGEVIDAILALIDNSEIEIDELLEKIQGPDFPTGGQIYGHEDIKTAYATGRGKILLRGTCEIVEKKGGGSQILVSEIPYQVNKSELILKIAELVKLKKLEGISDIRDESDRKEGVRIVIDLKSSSYPKKILNRLYELTPLQTYFHYNLLALTEDGIVPKILTLKGVLKEYIEHRKIIVRRRSEFNLKVARARAHILEGLLKALSQIDKIIETIKKSQDRDTAFKNLIKKFKLTEIQSNAILEMRLAVLAALERKKLETEYQEKLELIKKLENILQSPQKILEIIKKELGELKEKYATSRLTKIYKQRIGQFQAEDLIPQEQVIVTLSEGSYIKRIPVTSFKAQGRGGKGVLGQELKEEDVVSQMIVTNTLDDIMFFTDRGRVFTSKVYDLPAGSRISKGSALVNVLQISPSENVTAVISIPKDKSADKFFVMSTEKGMIKKTPVGAYQRVRKTGLIAIKLRADDSLKWVKTSSGTDQTIEITQAGQAIMFSEEDVRAMGRAAAGVRAIKLRAGDKVMAMDVVKDDNDDLMIVTENGLGKRTSLKNFREQNRGGYGLRAAKVTGKTGKVISAQIVKNLPADVIIASKSGQVIRMALSSVKKLGRDTQGVRLMRFKGKGGVATVSVIYKTKEITDLKKEISEITKEKPNEIEVRKEEIKIDKKQVKEIKNEPEKTRKFSKPNKPLPIQKTEKSKIVVPKTQKLPEWAKVKTRKSKETPKIHSQKPKINIRHYQEEKETNWWGKK